MQLKKMNYFQTIYFIMIYVKFQRVVYLKVNLAKKIKSCYKLKFFKNKY